MKKLLITLISVLPLAFSFCGCESSEYSTESISSSNSDKISVTSSIEKNSDKTSVTSSVEKNNDSQNDTYSSLTSEEQVSPEKVYIHTAISGAVITEQDGGKSFSYKCKCDICGNTDSITKNCTASGGTLKSSYYCSNCNEMQVVEIETNKE